MIVQPKHKYLTLKKTKKTKSAHNDGGRKRHVVHGPRTYDPAKHVMVVGPNGKRRMVPSP